MPVPFELQVSSAAAKYLSRLDKPTRDRFGKKFKEILVDPFDPAHSESLTTSEKREARVGAYRALILIDTSKRVVLVSEVAPRGQVYRDA